MVMAPKYTEDQVAQTGRLARFRSMGGEQDGWIMPDGFGVDYAGVKQLVFDPKDICNIRYAHPAVEVSS
jgi:hypothetical protein